MSLAAISRLGIWLFWVGTVQISWADHALGRNLLIGAASSLRNALVPIGSKFIGTDDDAKIDFNFASSGEIARQAKHGAPFDVVMTADERSMDLIEFAGLLAPGSRVDILRNELALVLSKSTTAKISSPRDLLQSDVRRIAICDQGVPAGQYALQWLKKLGLLEQLGDKMLRVPHVKTALNLVAHGAVDASFVYVTDISPTDATVVAVLRAGRAEGLDIRYVAAVLAKSSQADLARAFVHDLQSEQAWNIFKKLGFLRL